MVSKVYTGILLGMDCVVGEVEVDYRHGLSHFVIGGMGDKAVQEAKDRILSAVRNSGLEYIPKRVVVNLAPAQLPKAGSRYDLAIAVGLMLSAGLVKFDPTKKVFIGELALDGRVRSCPGVLAVVAGLKAQGFLEVFVPAVNSLEASLVSGIKVHPVESLTQLVSVWRGETRFNPISKAPNRYTPAPLEHDLAYVQGQFQAKRALEISAAGGHNLLMCGIPGAGKTMLAKCLPGILPPLTEAEALEVTKLHSIAGLVTAENPLVLTRPLRAPHYTISTAALIGGGLQARPGEISLAHRGILFLDEFGEFASNTLETLRQPLEDGCVTISRVAYTVSYPAQFSLVAAMNPCKCGYLGSDTRGCVCAARTLLDYSRKLSGPILDRVDLYVGVSKIDLADIKSATAESSESVASRVRLARSIQTVRQRGQVNALVSNRQIQSWKTHSAALDFLRKAGEQLGLSNRGYFRCWRVARTIADLSNDGEISVNHMAEALSYRSTTLPVFQARA